MPPDTEIVASFVAGFVAAEGTFVGGKRGRRFTFGVGLGAVDSATCSLLRDFFGCGNLIRSPRRKPHYDDECAYVIQSLKDHVQVTVPFMDVHLPVSHKREQYLVWRAALLEYWEHDAKRVRACVVEGCDRPRRAHQLCRAHLFAVRGV